VRHAPALATDESVGVLPLRTSPSDAGMLLPKRTKLVLRLPASLAGHAATLSGKELDLGTSMLRLGASKPRAIQPHCTLHAHLVSTAEGEVEFIESISVRLDELGVAGKLICGLRGSMTAPGRTIQGYSLVIHDLKPDASLRLQYTDWAPTDDSDAAFSYPTRPSPTWTDGCAGFSLNGG